MPLYLLNKIIITKKFKNIQMNQPLTMKIKAKAKIRKKE